MSEKTIVINNLNELKKFMKDKSDEENIDLSGVIRWKVLDEEMNLKDEGEQKF